MPQEKKIRAIEHFVCGTNLSLELLALVVCQGQLDVARDVVVVGLDLDELEAQGDRVTTTGDVLLDVVDEVGKELVTALEHTADDKGTCGLLDNQLGELLDSVHDHSVRNQYARKGSLVVVGNNKVVKRVLE